MLAPLTSSAALALLSPSARVVVASSLPESIQRPEELPWRDVHWPTLLSIASYERAEVQVQRLAQRAPAEAVPAEVHGALQRVCRVASFRSGEMGDAAAAACDALTASNVPALWLKGAALSFRQPAGFGTRDMGDLDILVESAQLSAASAALRASGWRDDGAMTMYDVHHHAAPLVWRSGLRLELHTGLFSAGHPFAGDSASAWLARGEWLPFGDRRVLALTTVWHLVHASIHWAWSHEAEVGTWQYLHDVHRLTAGWTDGDWSALVDSARRVGGSVPVGWALWTAAAIGGLRIPDGVVEGLRGPARNLDGIAEREWVVRALHSPMASPSVRWSRLWWRRAMRGLGDGGERWPWCLGRAGALAERDRVPVKGVAGGLSASPLRRFARGIERWTRHLTRVLGG